MGFANAERSAFDERIHVELVTALALIHHLVISKIYRYRLPIIFMVLSLLLIEFVPKTGPRKYSGC